jgi:competence protein ComEA
MRIHGLILGLVLPVLLAAPAFSQGTMAPAPAAAPAAKPAPAPMAAPAAKPAELIDINTATKEQLIPLKGIGDVRAEAIIKGRPYKGKDELYEKKIITKALYDDIKDKIIAKQK